MQIIGHGIDVVEIDRIARLLEEHGERFLDRCFTDAEREYAEAGGRRRIERYAADFAAKEALMKAIGTGLSRGVSWRDIEVGREPGGKPMLKIAGRSAEIAAELGIRQWSVSLSHSRGLAVASVIGSG